MTDSHGRSVAVSCLSLATVYGLLATTACCAQIIKRQSSDETPGQTAIKIATAQHQSMLGWTVMSCDENGARSVTPLPKWPG